MHLATWSPSGFGALLPSHLIRLILYTLVFFAPFIAPPAKGDLYEDRTNFRQAKHALALGRTSEYRRLRQTLDDYVLAVYLDYQNDLRRVSRIGPDEANTIRNRYSDYSLGDRFYRHWLNQQARSKRWSVYAEHYETSTVVKEQCNYLQALIHTGNTEAAFYLVPEVWVFGKSQPKECDFAFNRWIRADRVSNDLAWRRLELALEAKQTTLARYLLRFFSANARRGAESLIKVNRNTSLTRNQHNFRDDTWGRAALRYGLFKLVRSDSTQALTNWNSLRSHFDYSEYEKTEIEDELHFWLARDDIYPQTALEVKDYSVRTLGSILDTVLSEGNWVLGNELFMLLPEHELSVDKWRYWN